MEASKLILSRIQLIYSQKNIGENHGPHLNEGFNYLKPVLHIIGRKMFKPIDQHLKGEKTASAIAKETYNLLKKENILENHF